MEIQVEYTGSYPNLCSGKWIVTINSTQLDTSDWGEMDTYGEYSSWYFDDNYSEEWEDYEDGTLYPKWLLTDPGKQVTQSLSKSGITLSDDDMYQLYNQIQQHDFRHSSCGGCI